MDFLPRIYDEVKLLGLSRPGSNPPTLTSYKTVGDSPWDIQLPAFGPTVDARYSASDDFPHQWLEGSELEYHVHYKVPANVAAGDIVWGLAASIADADNGNTDSDFYIWGVDSVPANIAGQSRGFSIGTISPTGKKISFIGMYAFGRHASNPLDTWAGTALVTSFACHFLKDSEGSLAIATKY
jgi:hypothetical protein